MIKQDKAVTVMMKTWQEIDSDDKARQDSDSDDEDITRQWQWW